MTAQTAKAQIAGARPLADVLEKVTPAVINIAVTSGSPAENNPLYSDPYFRRFFDRPDMRRQPPRMSAGSGVIVDADKGYVITNHQVVEGTGEIAVTLKDSRRFTAELVGSDKATDVAVLKIEKSNLTALSLGDADKVPAGALTISKQRYSCFVGTGLEQMLLERSIDRIVVTGFMTNFCCEATARHGQDLDFFVDFPVDATGCPNRRMAGGLLSSIACHLNAGPAPRQSFPSQRPRVRHHAAGDY